MTEQPLIPARMFCFEPQPESVYGFLYGPGNEKSFVRAMPSLAGRDVHFAGHWIVMFV